MPSSLTIDHFIRLPEVKKLTGFSATSTIYRLMSEGAFPAAVKIGARAVAWPASAIAAWQAGRPCARNRTALGDCPDTAELELDLFGPGGLEGYRRGQAAKASKAA
jgi:prophage regulatory protein